MPRETVYDSVGMWNVEIGWTKERENVQVGISLSEDRSIAAWMLGIPAGSEKDGGPLIVQHGGEESKLPQFNSLWGTLDRAQINRLIKLLRKARDEAYGKDE